MLAYVGASVSSSMEGHRTHVSADSDMSPPVLDSRCNWQILKESESIDIHSLRPGFSRKLVQTHVRKICAQAPPSGWARFAQAFAHHASTHHFHVLSSGFEPHFNFKVWMPLLSVANHSHRLPRRNSMARTAFAGWQMLAASVVLWFHVVPKTPNLSPPGTGSGRRRKAAGLQLGSEFYYSCCEPIGMLPTKTMFLDYTVLQ